MAKTHPVHKRLIHCPECGMWAGVINRADLKNSSNRRGRDQFVTVLCRCDGPLCKRCGKNRIWRPISNHYDPADDSIWHTPHFGGLVPCDECKEREKTARKSGAGAKCAGETN